jgi:hypothetical protein
MRWQLGLIWTFLGATVVLGADPMSAGFPPLLSPRSARLLIPQPYDQDHVPVVRAQAEPPPSLGMTPVRRSHPTYGSSAPSQSAPPTWLRGVVEPESIRPAAATTPLAAPPPDSTSEAQSRRTSGNNLTTPFVRLFPTSVTSTTPAISVTTTNFPYAQPPFRGTNSHGATIYAGPPAYRWYGYGATTPPAFLIPLQGQYPRASADWYHITGATAGAFPLPVLAPPTREEPSHPTTSPPSVTLPPTWGDSALTVPKTLPPPIRPTPASFPQHPTASRSGNIDRVTTPSTMVPPPSDPRSFPASASSVPPSSVPTPTVAAFPATPEEATKVQPPAFLKMPSPASCDPNSLSPRLLPPIPSAEHLPWKPATLRLGPE